MTQVTIKIGSFDAARRAVPVTFTSGPIVHERDVNAVVKDDGSYDRVATKARVEEVARGVEHKIALGVITVPLPVPDLPAAEAPAE